MVDRRGLAGALVLAVGLIACSPGPSAPAVPTATLAAPTLDAPTLVPTIAPLTPAPTVSPVETPADTDVAGMPPCEAGDLKASHGLVEASGGGPATEVVLVSAGACSVPIFPGFTLRDADGATVLDSPPAGPGRLDLDSDVAYTSQVRLASWCMAEPQFPLTLSLVAEGGTVEVTGSSFPGEDDLLFCAPEEPAVLEASAWNPMP